MRSYASAALIVLSICGLGSLTAGVSSEKVNAAPSAHGIPHSVSHYLHSEGRRSGRLAPARGQTEGQARESHRTKRLYEI